MENTLIALAFLGGIAVLIVAGMSFSLYLHTQNTTRRGVFAQSTTMNEEQSLLMGEYIASNPVYLMRPETSPGTRFARATLLALALLVLAAISSIIVLINGLLR